MTNLSNTISTTRIARLKLIFGSAAIFASMAAAGQAEVLYPQLIPQAQTADVVRPAQRFYVNSCTQLERSAQLKPVECGTLMLSDVVARMNALERNDHDE